MKLSEIQNKELEQIIRNLHEGRLTLERFSSTEQRGLQACNRLAIGAALLAGRCASTSAAAQGGSSYREQVALGAQQEAAIEAWAKELGVWSNTPIEDLTQRYGSHINGGRGNSVLCGKQGG